MPIIPFGTICVAKLYLKFGCKQVTVEGLNGFLEKLGKERGILTVANHVSVVDEPFMWGVLPFRTFLKSKTVRWTLGAADVMFKGPFESWFFRKGQVIETFRGKGIYQEAIDLSSKKLDEGKWVHIFPEGRIKQENLKDLRRFKWGISRILMEAEKTPLIIPIWIQGFEKAMSEERTFPRWIPRPGHKLSIIIGSPINSKLEPLLQEAKEKFPNHWKPETYDQDVKEDLKNEPVGLAEMRSRLAEKIRGELMLLGKEVGEDGELLK